jgi:hypothetical protein
MGKLSQTPTSRLSLSCCPNARWSQWTEGAPAPGRLREPPLLKDSLHQYKVAYVTIYTPVSLSSRDTRLPDCQTGLIQTGVVKLYDFSCRQNLYIPTGRPRSLHSKSKGNVRCTCTEDRFDPYLLE